MIIKTTDRTLRALRAVADTSDHRTYCHGIHIDHAAGRLVASDGKVLLAAPFEVVNPDQVPADDHMIMLPVIGGRRATPATAYLDTDRRRVMIEGGKGIERAYQVGPAKIMEWQRVVKAQPAIKAEERIGVDPRLLEPIAKQLDAACTLELHGKDGAISVLWHGYPDLTCLVMPIRI